MANLTNGEAPLRLRFGGSLVEQLGAQLYPSATATIAELVSNAWDADADNVWVEIPLDNAWTSESRIVVTDDGNGMSRQDAQAAYLIVGRKKRLFEGVRSGRGRMFHGRKGIGKLAAFGTAGCLECSTLKANQLTSFVLDYDDIRKLNPDEDYPAPPAVNPMPLTDPITGSNLSKGTRITLTRLKLRRALTGTEFARSMSRRFAIDATQMRVFINGTPLRRFDVPLEFRFPRDGMPREDLLIEDGWAIENIGAGCEVRWWIGFTPKPIEDDNAIGVSVLAHDKMAQRPFEFERSQGLEGQLGLEYLVGEVKADWLDAGVDIEDDFIQSNRDQLQVEDSRLDDFMQWGRHLVTWAVRRRRALKAQKNLDEFESNPELDEMLKDYTKGERSKLLGIAKKLANSPESSGAEVTAFLRDIVNAKDDRYVRGLIEEIEASDDTMQVQLWKLVKEFGLIDARRTFTLIQARLETISKLKETLAQGAREIPTIHNIIRDDPWLVDPRWALLDDEVDLATLNINYKPEVDTETGKQLDYLFVLKPNAPAATDEVIVLEIKRASMANGAIRKASREEVYNFHSYVVAVRDHFNQNTNPPAVRGLMICEAYTAQADLVRKSLQSSQDIRIEFKTWTRVVEDTEKLHLGWLKSTRRRTSSG